MLPFLTKLGTFETGAHMVLLVAGDRITAEKAQAVLQTPDGCDDVERYEVVDFVNTHSAFPFLVRTVAAAVAVVSTVTMVLL